MSTSHVAPPRNRPTMTFSAGAAVMSRVAGLRRGREPGEHVRPARKTMFAPSFQTSSVRPPATKWPAVSWAAFGGNDPSTSSHRNLGGEAPAVSLRRKSTFPESSTMAASIMPSPSNSPATRRIGGRGLMPGAIVTARSSCA